MIDVYNTGEPQGFRFFPKIIGNRIRIEGFLFPDYADQMMRFLGEMVPWVQAGKVTVKETVMDGIESAPDAFLGLFTGANTGKMLVRI